MRCPWLAGQDDVLRAIRHGAGVVIVEGLCNLDQIQREEVQLIALPLTTQLEPFPVIVS